jgi:hypothetical protein
MSRTTAPIAKLFVLAALCIVARLTVNPGACP